MDIDTQSQTQSAQIALVWWGGLMLALIGVVKCVLYWVGARRPEWLEKIESPTLKRFLAGKSHRLIFGWGGFITVLGGLFFMAAAWIMGWFAERL